MAAIVLWLGGFTFYATYVIPAGERGVGGLVRAMSHSK